MKKILISASCALSLWAADIGYSIPVQAEILKVLAPELSTVALLPDGADPHTYEPKPSQIAELSKVNLYLAIGVESEQLWLPKLNLADDKIIQTAASIKKQPYAMIELAHEHEHEHHDGNHDHDHDHDHHEHHHDGDHHDGDHDHDHHHDGDHDGEHHAHDKHDHHHDGDHDHDHEHHDHDKHDADHHHDGEHHDHDHDHHHHHDHSGDDVHVWTTPANLKKIAAATSEAIAKAFPALAVNQPQRLAALSAKYDALNLSIKKALKDVKIKGFIDAHPSWGYFAKAYGLQEYSLEIHGKDIKPAQFAALKKVALDKKACVLINAPQFSTKLTSVLARETKLNTISANALAPAFISELEQFAKQIAKYCK